jgi:hypothetical protein
MNIHDEIDKFCGVVGVEKSKILGRDTHRDIANNRHILNYYLHYERQVATTTLAKLFGYSLRGIKREIALVKNYMLYDKAFRLKYEEIVRGMSI